MLTSKCDCLLFLIHYWNPVLKLEFTFLGIVLYDKYFSLIFKICLLSKKHSTQIESKDIPSYAFCGKIKNTQ